MKIVIIIFLISISCTRKYDPSTPLPGTLEEAVSSSFRAEENIERDEYQHPKETLEFFGLKPQMSVVEISPGAGYFTEILALYLSKDGQMTLAVPRMPPHPPQILIENEKKIQDILLRNPEVQAKAKLIPLEPYGKRTMTSKGFADMVLSFNSVHNWVAADKAKIHFQFFRDLLRPGGILGIVQHRIHEGKKRVPKSGYMYEKEVIDLARSAGFKLLDKSEINANPKDTADYPEGVWTLPPSFRLGEKDKKKYQSIGESDRMTLKFVKGP